MVNCPWPLPFTFSLNNQTYPSGRSLLFYYYLLLTIHYLLLTTYHLPLPLPGGEYRIRTDDPLLAKQVL